MSSTTIFGSLQSLSPDLSIIANVSSSVGSKAANRPDDVILVGGLLRIVNMGIPFIGPQELPLPSDATAAKLPRAIRTFQKAFNGSMETFRMPFRVSVDGRVSCASYIFFKTNHFYTIVALNLLARSTAKMRIHRSSIESIIATIPSLEVIIN